MPGSLNMQIHRINIQDDAHLIQVQPNKTGPVEAGKIR